MLFLQQLKEEAPSAVQEDADHLRERRRPKSTCK